MVPSNYAITCAKGSWTVVKGPFKLGSRPGGSMAQGRWDLSQTLPVFGTLLVFQEVLQNHQRCVRRLAGYSGGGRRSVLEWSWIVKERAHGVLGR